MAFLCCNYEDNFWTKYVASRKIMRKWTGNEKHSIPGKMHDMKPVEKCTRLCSIKKKKNVQDRVVN